MNERTNGEGMPARIPFRVRSFARAFGNFSLIRHRRSDGHLVSMHQSGTHWLKFMLANALSIHYGTPPPEYNHANDIIGGPRDPPVHAGLPRVISSHSMPHPLLAHAFVHHALAMPPYVLLVRDLRAALVSNFEKWRDRYATSFPDYLAGDPFGRRFNSDVWWAIRFLNGWGKVCERVPARVTVVRYEALAGNPERELARVAAALNLPLAPAAIGAAVALSGKDAMGERDDPRRPPGAVRAATAPPSTYFAAPQRAWFEAVCRRFLDYDFGYDYRTW